MRSDSDPKSTCTHMSTHATSTYTHEDKILRNTEKIVQWTLIFEVIAMMQRWLIGTDPFEWKDNAAPLLQNYQKRCMLLLSSHVCRYMRDKTWI